MIVSDLETWLMDYGKEKIFDVYVKANRDEEGTNRSVTTGRIVECVELPNKDVLLGFNFYDEVEFEFHNDRIEYYKLSEIDLIDRTKIKG